MFDRTIGSDPRPAAPQGRAIYRMRDGHRREYDASRDRGSTSFRERCRGALADIGIYGAVSVRDLAEAHFGGHPYTTRRAVNAWVREALAQETRATGPNGNPFKVLTLTRKGVAEARKLAAERRIDPGQEIGFARTRPAEAAHDTAIYRACRQEHQRLIEQGATVRRVRLDGEFKSSATLFTALELATGHIIRECMPKRCTPQIQALDRTQPGLPLKRGRTGTELTERQLRCLAVTSVGDLIDAVTRYIDERNQNPKPFVWTAPVRQILTKMNKAKQTSVTLH